MTWLAWRQFRSQAVAAAIAIAALGALLLVTGQGLAGDYADGLATCGQRCGDFKDTFVDDHQGQLLALTAVVLLVPALIGLFWGAPLIARELDAGTHLLAWNQSVTRTRWLLVKLAVVGAGAVVSAGLVTWAVDWWSDPIDDAMIDPRLPVPLMFAVRGVAPAAYALFAFVLGVTAGMLLRRPLPAMAVTLAVFAAVQVAMPTLVRPHLIPPVHATVVIAEGSVTDFMGSPGGPIQVSTLLASDPHAWILSNQTVDSAGRAVDGVPKGAVPAAACEPQENGSLSRCFEAVTAAGYRQEVTYQPSGRFWALQWLESGTYVALSAGLVGFCFWWLRRRVV